MKDINTYINESLIVNESYKDFIDSEEDMGKNVIVHFKTEYCPNGFFYEKDKVAFTKSDWEHLVNRANEFDSDTFLDLICNVDYDASSKLIRKTLKAFYRKHSKTTPIIYAMESYPEALENTGGAFKNIVASRIFAGVKFNDKEYNKLEKEFDSDNARKFNNYHKVYEITDNMVKITIMASANESSSMIVKY